MLVVTLQMLWKINILCCIRAPLRNRTNWCVCVERLIIRNWLMLVELASPHIWQAWRPGGADVSA